MRIEPPMSVPTSNAVNPAATAAAGPPEEPPGMWPRFHGLLVVPNRSLYVCTLPDQRGTLVLPNTIAPAAFKRATDGASWAGTWSVSSTAPPVERRPATSIASLIVIGSPWSGPRHSPRAASASARSASARARSRSRVTTALMGPFRRSMRDTNSSSSSRLVTRPSRMAAACSVADAVASCSSTVIGPPCGACRAIRPRRRIRSRQAFGRDAEVVLIPLRALAPLALVEPGVGPRVAVGPALLLAVGGEEVAHPLLGVGGELEAERPVDVSDGREGVGHEVVELHVDHPVRGNRPVLAGGDRPVEAFDDVLGPFGRDLGDLRFVRRHPPQQRDERRERGDDSQRVAVRLHQQRVGVLGEQRVEAPDVGRGLQHPAVGRRVTFRVTGLQVLQERAVPAVRRGHVRLVHRPVRVRRHPVLGGEDHAAEVRRGDAHALLREARAHRVHLLEAGDEQLGAGEDRVDLVDARVGVVGRGLRGRHRHVDLPREWHAGGRVLGEEVVQDRRAGAALADDDDRGRDGARADLGGVRPPLRHLQPAGEEVEHAARSDVDAELVELPLLAQRVDETFAAVLPGRLAEVVETGGLARLADEPVGIETRGAHRSGPSRWATTSASEVWLKSSYHCPMAAIAAGVSTLTTASASARRATTVSGGATGTARTTRPAPRARATSIAARALAPVARPSSTRTTVRPAIGSGSRSPR